MLYEWLWLIFQITLNILFISDAYQEKSLTVLPFFHIYGLNGILNFAIRNGVHVVTIPKFTPESYLGCLLDYKVRNL